MKKQTTKTKKLVLKKETLTSLKNVTGGSYVWDTVYRVPASERCATAYGCGIA